MLFIADLFREGGSWTFVMAGLSVVAILFALVAAVMHALRHRLLAALWLAPVVGVLLAGMIGAFQGRSILEMAFQRAAPEELQVMVAHGISIQLYTGAFCRVLVIGTGLLLAVAVAIGHVIGTRGERGRWTVGPGVAGGVLMLVGAAVSLAVGVARIAMEHTTFMVLLGCFVAFFAAFAVAAVGLRADADDERIGGTAGARAVVWIAALAAIWAAAGLPTSSGIVIAFKAVATAAAEHKAELLQAGIGWARADGVPGLWAVGATVLAGPALLIPCSAALRRTIGVVGAALAALLLLAGAGGASVVSTSVLDSFAWLEDMFLPDEINAARVACADRASRPGVFAITGKLQTDGTITELAIEHREGQASEPVRECLRERLKDLRFEEYAHDWGDYAMPESEIDWQFVMPPGDHVRQLSGR